MDITVKKTGEYCTTHILDNVRLYVLTILFYLLSFSII